LCQKWPYLKLSHSSCAPFKLVEYLNVFELGSKTPLGCPGMQLYTQDFDHQCHIWVNSYFLDVR